MPTVKLPIWSGSNKNVDEYGIGTLGAELRDAFIDELGNVRKRPGFELIEDLLTDEPVDGIYWWENQDCLIAVSNQIVFQITYNTGTEEYDTNQYSWATSDKLEAGTRVMFANYGSVLYAANGGKIFKIPASTGTSIAALADVDAPTAVTSLVTLDSYLICNNQATGHKNKFYWSAVLDPDTWEGDFATAESNADDLVNIGVANSLLYLIGTNSLETWYDDGVTPFRPLSQGFVNSGTTAPKSFAFCDGTFYWIDENRCLVRLAGNKVERLPLKNEQSISQYLQGLSTISDALATYTTVSGRHFYVLQLPTADVTLVYDIGNNTWCFWSLYNTTTGTYTRWLGNDITYSTLWNKTLIAHRSNGAIYEFSPDYVAEGSPTSATYLLDQNGNQVLTQTGSPIVITYGSGTTEAVPIRTLIRTGQLNHDTHTVKKVSAKYSLLCKRIGDIEFTEAMSVNMRWRDDGNSQWSEWQPGSILNITDTTFRIYWRRNGSYYTRQIEIENADPVPLVIIDLEETFDYGV